MCWEFSCLVEEVWAGELSWDAAVESVASVSALEVLEGEVVLEIAAHWCEVAVVGAAEGAAPELGKDALESFDEAVGPRVAGSDAAVLDAKGGAAKVEGAFELWAAVSEDSFEAMAGLLIGGKDLGGEEVGGGFCIVVQAEHGHGEGGGGIARGVLPDLADSPTASESFPSLKPCINSHEEPFFVARPGLPLRRDLVVSRISFSAL